MYDILIVVSATLAMIWFLIGSGLVMLAAFLIWRLLGRYSLGVLVATVLPTIMVVMFAVIGGFSEVAVSVILGVVIVNFGLVGLLNLCFLVGIKGSKNLLMTLWIGFGWASCFLAGRNGTMGTFAGLSLIIVGLMAVWQGLDQNYQKATLENKKGANVARICGRWSLVVLTVILLAVGASLMIGQHTSVSAVLGVPVSIFGAVLLAPICGLTALCGIKQKQQWQPEKLLQGLLWSNVFLITIGLGLTAVCVGGLHLTQSTLLVSLPWVAGLALLSLASSYLPQKTARWWGGLTLVLVFLYVVILLG